MENDFFLNATSSIPTWQSLSSAKEIQPSDHTQDCFFNNNSWDHHPLQFDSALSSMVSSPSPSNSNHDNFLIRELIGKLGNIGASSPSYINGGSTNTSCYTTPLSSPPKMNMAEFSSDPGFAERAAKFSCFGSRSFNGRTNQLPQVSLRSNPPLMENGKLARVSSSPSLKQLGGSQSQIMGVQENKNSSPLMDNSQEESTLSEQTPNTNSRKRKASKGKAKQVSSPKASEGNIEESNAKRSKGNENEGNENGNVKTEEDEKHNKSNSSKPPEPPKDYIHVRARRGQATDSHSLAERVRREKISERMKLLQDLVPGCNKVTGKALMLDEIINYVQSLQRQVEFLSMKLASVNTRLDFNIDNLISKEIFQSNNTMAHPNPIFHLDSSAQGFYGHQQNPGIHNNIVNGSMTHTTVDPLEMQMQLPSLIAFNTEGAPQFPVTFCEDDLHTIVQMGFGQTAPTHSHNLNGSNQVSHMKVEL